MVVEQEGFIGAVSEPREAANPKIKQIEKKTPKMREVERGFERIFAGFGLPIHPIHIPIELILPTLYQDGERSQAGISEFIQNTTGIRVKPETIGSWLKRIGVRPRTKSESGKILWKDEERRNWLISRIHSPEAKRKRSKSLKERWKKSPERKREFAQAMKKRRKKAKQRGMREVLGENPKKELRRLYWEECLRLKDLEERLGRDASTLGNWLEELGVQRRSGAETWALQQVIKPRRELVKRAFEQGLARRLDKMEQEILRLRFIQKHSLKLREIGGRLGVSHEKIRQIEKRALRKLSEWMGVENPDEL